MAIFCPLFSGSSGNSIFISSGEHGILIDVGVSCKKITDSLNEIGFDPAKLSAVFITHEHIDHIQGLRVFYNKYHIPIYCSPQTADAIRSNYCDTLELYDFSDYVSIEGFMVKRFATSHDCEGSSAYRVTTPDQKQLVVCTDLGRVTEEVQENLDGCDLVMLESNHEVGMLQSGSYPYDLKRRILSDRGHLSNACCAEEIGRLVHNGCKRFVVGHLSKDNNHPLIAQQTIETALSLEGFTRNIDYILEVAPPSGGKIMVV